MKKFFKILGIVVASLILLYFGACIFGPKELKVTRTISINAPANEVFQQVGDFKNWSNWSMWSIRDKNMQSSFEGEPMLMNHKWT